MACLLILGAIPSGLAGTAHNAETLYVLRFFIGILGATFVPCQAWTSAFFDKNCVGFANALVGGWGEIFPLHHFRLWKLTLFPLLTR
jgi:NNP family nitrate/nitrite transporter-like MFS transporter